MINIKLVQSDPDLLKNLERKRNIKIDTDKILSLYEEQKSLMRKIESCNEKINSIASMIGMIKAGKKEASEEAGLKNESIQIGQEVCLLKKQLEEVESELHGILSNIPNLLDESVPEGLDESSNQVVREVGRKKIFDFNPKSHSELGPQIGISFNLVTKISGSRFSHLIGECALLDRAIKNFMIDTHLSKGFGLINAPFLVEAHSAYQSGQLPKFKEDMFRTDNGMYLIPTSEVYMANLFQDNVFGLDDLPIRMICMSSCFRKEAGSSGANSRGIIRQHQFDKVEMFSVCSEDKSSDELEFLVDCGEDILKKLDIPFRTILLCSGDTGFCSSKTYDIEFFSPFSNNYIEISSCSNVKDFQSRRSKARYVDQSGKKQLLHFLNGSGLAVGRTIVAIIENYQQKDGSIIVPEVLAKYMNGIERLVPKKYKIV